MDKLVLMGICTRKVMPDGTTMYKVKNTITVMIVIGRFWSSR